MIQLDKDEHILFEVRKHWFVFSLEITILFLIGLVPAIVFSALSGLPVNFASSAGSLTYLMIFIYSAWVFILWIVGFMFWTDYYLDIWIITNKKIIDVEQLGLFRREISILHLDKIQDITSEVRGLLPTIINYGTIHVQTAGQQREFIIKDVPKPDQVRFKLNEALTRNKDIEKVVIASTID